jgi:hypothetical protein
MFDRRVVHRHGAALVGAELTYEGVVDDIRRAGVGRGHVDDRVVTRRPQGVDAVPAEKVTLALEMPHLGQGQGQAEAARCVRGHGNIVPALTQGILPVVHLADDLPAQPVDLPQGGFSAMPARPMIQAPSG